MNSGFLHTSRGLSGLSGLPGGVPDARLREYVAKIMQQENGRLPTAYKLGGNMAWWKRATDPSRDMHRFFAALGWNPERALAELQRRLPGVWGVQTNSAAPTTGNDGSSPPAAAPSKSGINWWLIGGLGLAGLGGGLLFFNDDKQKS